MMGQMKGAPKKGIQYKAKRIKPAGPAVKWNTLDEKVRSGSNFAKRIMDGIRKELGDEGFAVKRMFYKGVWVIVIKKDGKLASFQVPFMRRGKYEVFISEVCNMLVKSYNDTKDKDWVEGKISERGFTK